MGTGEAVEHTALDCVGVSACELAPSGNVRLPSFYWQLFILKEPTRVFQLKLPFVGMY